MGIDRIAELADELEIECDLRRAPNFTYTEDPARRAEIEAECEAAIAAGLPASYVEETELPFEVAGAVRFERQAEFHPVKYLLGIAAALEREGGSCSSTVGRSACRTTGCGPKAARRCPPSA